MVKNISAFTVRELDNQQALQIFRTSAIGDQVNGGVGISGNGGTFSFHASGFWNVVDVRQVTIVGEGVAPTNFDVEFGWTSSLVSTATQYLYTQINKRVIDLPNAPFSIVDLDNTNCLHGKITNNATSGMTINVIDIRCNRMLEVS